MYNSIFQISKSLKEYRRMVLAAFLITFHLGLFAQTPIAHYPLNGNANDAGSNGLNGTIIGTVTPTPDRFGNANSAMQFEGGGQVEIGANLADQNFAISMWVKPGSTQNQFADIMDNNHTGFQNWVLQQDGSTLNRYVFGVHRSDGGVGIFFNLQSDIWQHVVVVKSATALEAYINGVLDQTTAWTGTVNFVSPSFRLGNWANGSRNWNGGMDEVKYFNTALSAAQVQAEFTSTSSGLVAYYPFAGNANDAAGSLNGTVNGATLTTDRFGNPNSAYSFDGVDDFIGLNHNFGPFTELTVSAWYKVAATSPDLQAIVSSDASGKLLHMQVATDFVADNAVYFSGGPTALLSHPQPVLNQWRHVVITAKSGESKLYINGDLVDTKNLAFTQITAADLLRIGSGFQNGRFFNGAIDEVKIYNTALSAAQVQADFNTSNSGAHQKPGSGNAISFDGQNDVIQVPNSAFNNFTMELWMNTSQPGPGAGGQAFSGAGILSADLGSTSSGDFIPMALNGNFITFGTGDGGDNTLTSSRPVVDGNWHHVAITRNQTTGEKKIYIDGIESASGPGSSLPYNASPSLFIGADFFDNVFYQGKLDEVRFWNVAMTQAQIRDRMCRKITSSDALFGNLVAYYNFDETSGNTVFDGTANANNGTLTNGPTRVTSGAAIGNSSSHNYVSTGFPSTNLTTNGQDNLAVSLTSGTFTGEVGTHVYAVSEKPNTESGIENPGSNDRYFGVFHAGIANPQYTATYNYSGNSFVTTGNEAQLSLFKRNDNAGTAWTNANATLNSSANTLTVTGQSTEYVLGVSNCTTPATPTISASGSLTFCTGDSVTLTSSSSTGNIWSNGATSPSIKVKTAGSFTVQVVLAGCSSAVSAATNVIINTPPAAAVITSPSGLSFCSGSSLTLESDQSTFVQWQRNSINISGQTGASLVVSTAGTYRVIRTQNGCSSTSNALVISENTNVPPVPTITSGGQTSFCANASLGLLSSANEGNQWIRNGTDINGATSNTLIATQAGTYAVRVTVGGCSRTSANLVLTTLPAPTVSISTSAPGICPSNPVVLSTTGTALSAREWLLNGASTNQFGTTFSASTAGSYSVIGTAANGCQTTSSAVNVQADIIPTLTSNKPANTICSGTSIQLTSTPGASFLWNTGATTSSITVSPGTTTNFSVQTTGALGCVFNDAITVTVVPSLTPGAVSNLLPDNGSINQENAITFSWQPASNAISYDLYVWPAPGSRPANPNQGGIVDISATLNNLPFGTFHNYQVVSRSACQTTDGPLQQFTTRSLPDLVVSNVVYPNSRISPGSVRATYTVQNIGQGMTLPATWTERLYLSLDSVLDGSDQAIGSVQNLTGLLPGASYTNEITGYLSDEMSGAYFLFVRINDGNSLFETTQINNVASGNPGKLNVTVNNTLPDLTAGGPIGVPPLAVGGTLMNYNYDILNSGQTLAEGTDGPLVDVYNGLFLPNFSQPLSNCLPNQIFTLQLKGWSNSVYLSKDTIFNPETAFKISVSQVIPKKERPFTGVDCNDFEFFHNGLPAGEHILKSAILLLPASAIGKHFLHIVLNDYLPFAERSRANNVITSPGFEVVLQPPADIRLVSGNLGAAQATILNPVSIQYQAQNIGNNTAKNWTDKIFVSKSAVFNSSARLLQTFTLDSLAVGLSYTKNSFLRIPAEFEGSAFIHIRTGIGLFEHTFTENNNLVLPVTVNRTQLPDLKILTLEALTNPVQGDSVVFQVKVKNTGNTPTFVQPLELKLAACKNSGFSALDAIHLASVLVDSLGVNDEQILNISAVIPPGFSGQVFFRAVVDESDIQPELIESNNARFSVYGGPGPGGTGGNPIGTGSGNSASDPFVAGVAVGPGPQLDGKIRSVSFSSPAQSGFETTVRVKIEPIAPQIGLPISATLKLSLVDPANPGVVMAIKTIPFLVSDTSTRTLVGSLNFGPQVQGLHTLKVSLDLGLNQFGDSDPANNQTSQAINLVRPLLPDLVVLSAEIPANFQSGGFFTIPIVVKNQGSGGLQTGFEQRAYLSNSPLGTSPFASIGVGSNINGLAPGASKNDTLKGFIPTTISGNFFLVIKADANSTNFEGEAGELNNQFIQNVIVVPPAPIDLVAESVTLPSSFTVGRNVNGSLVCRNLGPGQALGSIQNLLRVSKSLNFDPETDSELGIKTTSVNLLANGTVFIPFKGNAQGILPGSYRGLGQVNSKFTLPETNFLNNSGLTSQNLSLNINSLPIGQNVEVTNMELDEVAYFKITTTAELDLVATFNGNGAFASFEKVPTSNVADFRERKNSKNMLIPSTQAGNYFIGVKPFNQAGNIKAIIQVQAIPFGVSGVSPSLVGAGPVSTYVTGGGFTEGTIFEAFQGNTLVATGSILELFNSMEGRVKWNFTGVALGPVTIKVRKQGATGVTTASLTLEAVRKARLLSEVIGSNKVRRDRSLLQNIRYFNDGNVDIEYGLGLTSFPGFAKAKSISVSDGAFLLGDIHTMAGIRCNKITKQTYFDMFVQIPVFVHNMGPGEEFSVKFYLTGFGEIDGIPVFGQGVVMDQPELMEILVEEIEKSRFAHIVQPDAFLASANLDSAAVSDKFRRAALRGLVNHGFISSAMVVDFNSTNYKPDFSSTAPTFKAFGTIRSPEEDIVYSALLIMGDSFSFDKLPKNKILTTFVRGNAMVTYSNLFLMPLSNFLNLAILNKVNPKLSFNSLSNISLTGIQNSQPFVLPLVGNSGGGVLSNFIFGPKALLYHNSPLGFPSLPPFPVPPPQLILPDEELNNAWHPFQGPDFIPQAAPDSDPDPRDLPIDDESSSEPGPQPDRGKVPDFDKEVEKYVPPTKKVKPFKEFNWKFEYPDPCDMEAELFLIKRKYFECRKQGVASRTPYIEDGQCSILFRVGAFNFCQLDKKYAQKLFDSNPCTGFKDFSVTKYFIDVTLPCDPNEIEGPAGVGESKMVSKTQDLHYIIRFENDPKLATAAAQNVRIIQPLDVNFKSASFALGSYGFGNQEFTIPANQNTFSTQLDFTNEKGIKVNVAAALDVLGKRLIWSFSTIDAFTGLPSSDPESGFLPVNDSTGKGEGFVSYTIQPGLATQTGDSLRAQAEIFFDFNDPIKTNRHWNVVDALPPATTVSTPSGTQAETDFALSWTTQDDEGGSGAESTWIFFKKDGGALDTLGRFPADTGSIDVAGFETGHSYGFFFRSQDRVANQEELPTEANLTITIGTLCNLPTPTISVGGPLTFCQGGSVLLTSSVLHGNRWNTGDTTQSITVSISDTITLQTVAAGCTSAISVPVVVVVNPLPAKPVITPSGPLVFCQGGSVTLTTNAAAGHGWSTGSTLNSITVTSSITVSDTAKALGCKTVSDPVTVTVNPLPVVNAGLDVLIEAGQSANLTATGAATYQWSPLQNITPANGVGATVSVNPNQTTLYTVTGTDANNCFATDAVLVTVSGGSGPLTAPQISPATGTFSGPQMVTITSTSPGAEIYYTTSGNVPVLGTGFTKLYTAPFQLIQSATVRAMAVKSGQANSPVAVSFITITNPGVVSTPVISPGAGSFEGLVSVSLSTATSGAEIWYTTNGNSPRLDVPNSFTKLYTGPFTLFGTTTVKAMGAKAGLINSSIAASNFVVNNPAVVAAPTFSPPPGNYPTAQTIAISCATPGAQIYFSNNGITPGNTTPAARLYSTPFVVGKSGQIKAIAFKDGFQQSVVSVGTYTIGPVRINTGANSEDFYFESDEYQVLDQELKINLVPNPGQGRFYILAESAPEPATISVVNLLGQTIWEGKMEEGQTQLEIDITRHAAGIYSLRYTGKTSKKEIRLTKY